MYNKPCVNILLAVNSIHKHFYRCFCATGCNVCWVFQENLADPDDDVLSLMVNKIRFCTQVLGLEVITWVNVEEVPVIVLC